MMGERAQGGLLVYSSPRGHLSERVDPLCDNPLKGTFMSSAPLRTFHFSDNNCRRAPLSCVHVCTQACVSIYLVGAPRSMKWLPFRMEWPSHCENRSTKSTSTWDPSWRHWGNEQSGALQVWGRARQRGFLRLCTAPTQWALHRGHLQQERQRGPGAKAFVCCLTQSAY